MTLRDVVSSYDAAVSVAPAVRTNGTTTGAAIDLRGYDAAAFMVTYGAWTDGTHTPAAEASADGTSWSAIAAADLQGSFVALAGTSGTQSCLKVGYIGDARYVRGVMVTAGATTGAASSMNVVRAEAHRQPV